jgi:hypothetical protein
MLTLQRWQYNDTTFPRVYNQEDFKMKIKGRAGASTLESVCRRRRATCWSVEFHTTSKTATVRRSFRLLSFLGFFFFLQKNRSLWGSRTYQHLVLFSATHMHTLYIDEAREDNIFIFFRRVLVPLRTDTS